MTLQTTRFSGAKDRADGQLLIATGNAHKVEEISRILHNVLGMRDLRLRTAGEFSAIGEPDETGDSYEANALIKARAYAQATGLLTLADDSGLEVKALDGRPGIGSARFAASPQARIERVWREMAELGAETHAARFVCVVALVDGEGHSATARGEVRGRIIHEIRGAGGFGYDPIFQLDESGLPAVTMAELDAAAKDRVSHRGRALTSLAPALRSSLAAGRLVIPNES